MMNWGNINEILFGGKRDFRSGGCGGAFGEPGKGSVLKLNWEGHRIKIFDWFRV